jgi:type IV pilus assembly protein PilE
MNNYRGFTMIELMIVIAVIGILSAIAMPQYNQYVLRGKLTEAVTQLSDLRVRLEQSYQDNRNFGPNAAACTVVMPTTPAVKFFTYTCTTGATGQTYLLTATSRAGNGLGAAGQFVYTVTEADVRATTLFQGVAPAPAVACWITTRGAGC